MPITVQDLDAGVTMVALSGRIDIAGTHEIDVKLRSVSSSRNAVVIDLARVEFIASMGLRSLVLAAKAIASRQGKVVLLSPKPEIEEVIRVSGIDSLMPVHDDAESAIGAVRPG